MKTIFYDVDTQNDFMNKDGALYVPDAEELKPSLAALTLFACENGIPVFGSVDRHFGSEQYRNLEAELQRNGGPFPDHCMNGTEGQRKIRETEYGGDVHKFRVNLGFVESVSAALAGFNHEIVSEAALEKGINAFVKCKTTSMYSSKYKRQTAGIFFEKQQYDVASNPWFEKVMKLVAPRNAVVYGVAADYCVKAAVLGLRALGVNVFVVEDAIKGVALETTKKALEEMINAGAKMVTTRQVVENRLETYK